MTSPLTLTMRCSLSRVAAGVPRLLVLVVVWMLLLAPAAAGTPPPLGEYSQEWGRVIFQTYGYDGLNRLNAVMWGGQLHQYGYDTAGRLGTATAGNGLVTSFGYDSDSRLRTQTTMRGASAVASYGYTVDAAGRRTDVTESGGATISYGYDSLHRLVSSNRTIGGTTDIIGYEHDAVGNRTKLTRNGVAGLSFYDANDRLAVHQYDAAGNTTSSPAGADQYDSENRLVRRTRPDGSVVSIAYDGDGTKVSETVGGVTTWFLVSDLNPTGYSQTIEERRGGVATQRYVWGLGLAPVAIQAGESGAMHFPVTDGQGSVRLLTDGSGSVTDSFDFDEFGVLIGRTGTTRCTHLYSGYAMSEALGSYYLRARYYAPETGRLWTMDEFEGLEDDPLSLHKYMYCEDNPVNGIDPTGNFFLADLLMAMGSRTSVTISHATNVITTGAGGLRNVSIALLQPMFRMIGNLPVTKSQGKKLTGRTWARRFFVQDTVTYPSVDKGFVGRWLQRLLPGIRWEQGHIFIQRNWFNGSTANRWYPTDPVAQRGLRRLGNAGWNLMAMPRGLNAALGRSRLGTFLFGGIVAGLAAYDAYVLVNEMSEIAEFLTQDE